MVSPDTVALPVLITRNEYVIDCPDPDTVVRLAVLTSDTAAVGVMITRASDGVEIAGPPAPAGGAPCDVAVFVTKPVSTSACVRE